MLVTKLGRQAARSSRRCPTQLQLLHAHRPLQECRLVLRGMAQLESNLNLQPRLTHAGHALARLLRDAEFVPSTVRRNWLLSA